MTAPRALAPALILAVSSCTLLYRLGEPPFRETASAPLHYSFDETYWAFSAHRAALGDPDAFKPRAKRAEMMRLDQTDLSTTSAYLFSHPPTALLMMAGAVGLFGWTPWASRISSVLFGLLTLFLTWLLAKRLRPGFFAVAVTVLVATDGVFFVLSRTAMSNIHATACTLLALYGMLRFWTEEQRARWLLLAGLGFGLSFAIKWSVGGLAFGLGVLALGHIGADAFMRRRQGRLLITDLAAWVAAFTLIPAAIYLLAYVPYFIWWHHSWADFMQMQHLALGVHGSVPSTYTQSSPWYSWPLLQKPVLFYLGESANPQPAELDRFVFCIGDPLLWWSFVPALGYVAYRYLRFRQPADGLVLCGFFGTWLPWALTGRFTYLHYLLPAVPLGAMAVAIALDDLQTRLKLARPWLLIGGAVLSVVAFVHFYPVLAAVPIPRGEALDGRYLNLADGDLLGGKVE